MIGDGLLADETLVRPLLYMLFCLETGATGFLNIIPGNVSQRLVFTTTLLDVILLSRP
jgi:hypothetical protein